jgi:hypothetical protein
LFALLGTLFPWQEMQMAKRKLTDRFVRTLKPAPSGKRIEIYDTGVPCFGVRVTDRGHRTYILYVRWPNSKTATRREIGNADRLSLALARKKARSWLELVELGIDPGEQLKAEHAEAKRKREITFEAVFQAWLPRIKHQRKADEVERDVEREFISRWRTRNQSPQSPCTISSK